jgi:hypothetical protein
MANTNVFETKLSKRMQVTRYSTPVFMAQASFEERATLMDGQSVVRPTFGRLYADTYTRGSDMSEQGYTETSETLTVNTIPAILLRADNFDALQHKSSLQDRLAKDGIRAVNKSIDAEYLAQVSNATSFIDAGDVGGTAGQGISLDSSNILKIYAAAQRKLQGLDVDIIGAKDPRPEAGNMKPMGGAGFANVAPEFNEQLALALAGRETVDGDMVGKNGYKSTYFSFDTFVTTNGLWEGVLAMATNPTDGDTLTINGVVITFRGTLGSTAGSVHIASTVDITRANLAEFLNAPGTSEAEGTDTGYVALSEANQNKLRRMTFTNDNSADTLTVVAKGYGHVVVSETFTAAGNVWSSQISHQMFGQKGAIDMVMQKEVGVEISDIPKQFGKYIKPRALYGLKTFTEGADALVDVRVDSSNWA